SPIPELCVPSRKETKNFCCILSHSELHYPYGPKVEKSETVLYFVTFRQGLVYAPPENEVHRIPVDFVYTTKWLKTKTAGHGTNRNKMGGTKEKGDISIILSTN
ncbi:MAG: hypothetical protein AAFQ98_24200, partial [Bacteroidota bacterium]